MSKEKFTPGPWEYHKHSWQQTSVYSFDRLVCTSSIDEDDIPYDDDGSIQTAKEEIQAANMRLCAAAPEMYALLESLSQVLYNGHSERDAIDYLAEIHDDIKNILAKARGETTNQP